LNSSFKDVYKKLVQNKLKKLDVPLQRYITKIEYYLENILKKNKTDKFLIHKMDRNQSSGNKFSGNFNPFGGKSKESKVKVKTIF
jgi:hypothetical protein